MVRSLIGKLLAAVASSLACFLGLIRFLLIGFIRIPRTLRQALQAYGLAGTQLPLNHAAAVMASSVYPDVKEF